MTRRSFVEKCGVLGLALSNATYSALSEVLGNVSDKPGNKRNIETLGGDGIFTNIWVDSSVFPKLKEHNIKYVFVDIGDVNKSTGKITTPGDQIETFMNEIASFEKENNYRFTKLPWNVVIPEEGYKLESPEFRRNYVAGYVQLAKQFRLDGIHVDIEAIPDELKGNYLKMLSDWRTMLPEKSIISVYGGSLTDDGEDNIWNWPERFLPEVFKSGADMVSIPTYDTASRTEKEYRAHINDQIRRISRQKTGFFRYPVPTHKPGPELAEFALDEYLNGNIRYCNWPFSGVDLFATWTITDSDWNAYEQYVRNSKDSSYLFIHGAKDFLCKLGLDF